MKLTLQTSSSLTLMFRITWNKDDFGTLSFFRWELFGFLCVVVCARLWKVLFESMCTNHKNLGEGSLMNFHGLYTQKTWVVRSPYGIFMVCTWIEKSSTKRKFSFVCTNHENFFGGLSITFFQLMYKPWKFGKDS